MDPALIMQSKNRFMEYTIKPRLYITDQKFWVLSDEINRMDRDHLQDGIDSCELVMTGKHIELWWGLDIAGLKLKKDISILEHNLSFVAEIPTIEIHDMLKNYMNELIEFDKKQNSSK